MRNAVEFHGEGAVLELARFVAELVREGVTFTTMQVRPGHWQVTLTGGF